MIDTHKWHPADGLKLEPNAHRACIEQERCLVLTAGPGAGKTEMLAQRADFLLRTGTCRYPRRILAISFKVDASHNIKERVSKRCGHSLAERFDSYTFHAFAKRIIERFRPILTGDDALSVGFSIGEEKIRGRQITFKDLVPLAVKILNSSEVVRKAIRETYSDVFLDEFQDCTNEQYELVCLAFAGTQARLTAVGDTKQKIMAWAGALDGIFETFADDFKAISLNMYSNFRSQARLLKMQNDIIAVIDPKSMMPADQVSGDEGEVCFKYYENSVDEAKGLADLIESWIDSEDISASDIAVLVSKQPLAYVDKLVVELDEKEIPYRNEQQLQDLSKEPITRLIIDYLSCLYGDREPAAWVRLMAILAPIEYSQPQLDMSTFIRKEKKRATIEDLKDSSFENRWKFVRALLNQLGKTAISMLSPEYESIDRLKEIIKETSTRINELLEQDPDLLTALNRFSDYQAVRIMTIHKSKGLEFDSVIILGVENEAFWGDESEERCAFFVGMSRAERRLVLTACGTRGTPPSRPYRWREDRSPHVEFLEYAAPYVIEDKSL